MTLASRRPRILVLSRNYPNNVFERSGLWVQRLVVRCEEHCHLTVISPVPYFPPVNAFPEYSRFRHIARQRCDGRVGVYHPRFFTGPGRSLYHIDALSYYLGIRGLADKLHSERPFDLIHAHFIYPDGVAGALLAHRYRVPLVTTEHAPWCPNWIDSSAVIRSQALWAAQKSTFQIAVSTSVQSTITRLTNEPNKIRVIPCGVEEEEFSCDLQQTQNKNKNQILFVGFINFNKGIDVLLQAMQQLASRRPSAVLKIVGGSFFRNTRLQEERLRRLAQEMKLLDRVEFCGPKPPHEVNRIMRESAVLVLPSRAESFGTVLVEALASGTPVVATRCGGPEDIVTPGTGILVGPGNPSELATGIETVLDRLDQFDPIALRNYAIEQFAWSKVASRVMHLYQEAFDRFVSESRKPECPVFHRDAPARTGKRRTS